VTCWRRVNCEVHQKQLTNHAAPRTGTRILPTRNFATRIFLVLPNLCTSVPCRQT